VADFLNRVKTNTRPELSVVTAKALFPYQVEIAARAVAAPHAFALYMQTGTGKTILALEILRRKMLHYRNVTGKDLDVIVVCPLSVSDMWRDTARTQLGDACVQRLTILTYESFATLLQRDPNATAGKFLIFDEAHRIRTAVYPNLRAKLRAYRTKIGKVPQDQRTDHEQAVVVRGKAISQALSNAARQRFSDPVNLVRNDTGVDLRHLAPRSYFVVLGARTAAFVLLLTATPLYNSELDLLNHISILKGESVMSRKAGEAFIKDRHLLQRLARTHVAFRDIAPDDPAFPRLVSRVIRVPMSEPYYQRYRDVEQSRSDLFTNPFVFMTGVRQATLGLDVTNSPKYNQALELILEGAGQGADKVLVFSAFITHGLRGIQARCTELGIRWVEITGDTPLEARNDAVRDFNADIPVLFVSAAGGEGLDLKGTRRIILLESEWNQATEDQVVGRGPRRGSHLHLPLVERQVDVYRLILIKPADHSDDTTPSADEVLQDLSQRKQVRIREVLEKMQG
jgi:superfamily II DNA or RNA helicase